FVSVLLSIYKLQVHTKQTTEGEHRIGNSLVTAHESAGPKSESRSGAGGGQQMIGPGPTEGDQLVFATHLCLAKRVFQLTPFIARDERMDQIIPFNPHMNTVFL